MRKLSVLFFIAVVLPVKPILAHNSNDALQVILDHQEECVQSFEQGKIYLLSDAIQLKNHQFALDFMDEQVVFFPFLYQDVEGYYIECNQNTSFWQCRKCNRVYSGEWPPSACKCGFSGFKRYGH